MVDPCAASQGEVAEGRSPLATGAAFVIDVVAQRTEAGAAGRRSRRVAMSDLHWWRIAAALAVVTLILGGCREARTPGAPSPPAASVPVPTGHNGPVEIVFLDATPSPGATVAGCGASISGCRNRLTMRFALRAQEAGPVLYTRAFLHATNLLACLTATTGPFELTRGETRQLTIVFDESDGCGVPLTIANMAVVVEGPVQVASRQTWSSSYTFAP